VTFSGTTRLRASARARPRTTSPDDPSAAVSGSCTDGREHGRVEVRARVRRHSAEPREAQREGRQSHGQARMDRVG
jgi:hypothetical protein